LSERPYLITVKGIEDLPDTETAKKVIEKAEEYEKELADKLRDKKKKGEKENSVENSPTEALPT
jgi:hypothetical protein